MNNRTLKTVWLASILSLPLLLGAGSLLAEDGDDIRVSREELKQLIREAVREELGTASTPAPQAEPVTAPEGMMTEAAMLTHACAGCHGTNGNVGNEAFMPLAGMPQQEFINTMLDFRNDKRIGTLMGHVAKGYSEDEIALMAGYYASLDDPLLTNKEGE